MKIATFNVNNIDKRLPNLLEWLGTAKPDVVCLQELKVTDAGFPKKALEKHGYRAAWQGEKSWNGVAILARGVGPIVTRRSLPGDAKDSQARYIEAAVNGILIGCLYAPNGNPQPGPKFTYKLAWLDRLYKHAAGLYASGAPVVLAGDYNVVPTERDIYPSKSSYKKNALVQPESRERFRRFLAQGWLDAIRSQHPDTPMFTFWDYMRDQWARDSGLRIDHLLLSPAAAKRLQTSGVDRDIRGKPNASDHAPAWITMSDSKGKGGKRASTPPAKTATPAAKAKPSSRTKKNAQRPLLVIDGDSFAHRSYHALPKTIMRRGKKPAGAILGFANVLLRLYRAEQPRAVLVAWDTLEADTYRHTALPAYQSGREFDDALVEQLDILPEVVAAFGFANAKKAGYEADDFLAAAAVAEEKRGGTVLIVSGDRDSFQLASSKTTILYPLRAGETARIGPNEVRERYGVDPKQVPDFIALRGDPSDKIPGAQGIGPAGAANLIQKHGTLEAVLKAGRFPTQADDLRLYKKIATMNAKAPLPKLPDQVPTWTKAAKLMSDWQLGGLAGRIEEMAKE